MKTTHHAELDRAEGVELPVWQAPNDDVHLTLNGDHAKIIFQVWDDQAKYSSHCGVLDFSQMWGIRCERNKDLSYYPNMSDDEYKSCYWVVPNSSWLRKLQSERNQDFPGWEKYDKSEYVHYIVQSNKFYIEIIAASIKFSRLLCCEQIKP
ncbi:hypothetical protein [Pseudomonas sp.]|uniref:hypothetical protein n=1 Tax=Pseudomonas sp. TaxID=306 RepID=UPI002606103B|nr:hypothetical protein [Pseudomonas sp.]